MLTCAVVNQLKLLHLRRISPISETQNCSVSLKMRPDAWVCSLLTNQYLKMAPSTKVIFQKVLVTDLAFKFGLMVPNMRESGVSIRLMAGVNSGTQMETYMKACGKTTRLMVMAFMYMLMAPNMKATGKTIYKMAQAQKAGAMAASMKAATKKE